MNRKKLIIIFVALAVVGFISGACGYFGVAYIKAGGTADGVLVYIEQTVIPSLISALGIVLTALLFLKPIAVKVIAVVGAFNKAKESVEEVRNNGALSVTALNQARAELFDIKQLVGEEVAELKEIAVGAQNQYAKIKTALEIAFTNNAELVKNGYAKQIYDILEEKNEKKS